ncbi:glycosyltransferase family 2 protein [Capnocytophaga catalasegens]|uniref:glycosyltransferase family 2 protein n=1 Tax=Capnocytophaga catalasegens TaxID=1004260 RepID=UPI00223273C8|nr:glycosyltransferase family 2 protein [Capnocytophaga catalasegens]GIZ15181.1 sugar transferase [Capnocytophaga catalasegens]
MQFSIIIPVYNVERYLPECVNSVLSQDFLDYEVILVNDGSTDESGNICDEYVEKYSNIKVIHKENGGLSDARNFGIKEAKGNYLMFLDSDDFWQGTNILSDLSKIIQKEKPDLILFGHTQFIDGETNITLNNDIEPQKGLTYSFQADFKYLVDDLTYKASACDKIIKREIIVQNEIFFPKGKLHEDIAWCYDIIDHIKVYQIYPKCFYCYRRNRESSITHKTSEKAIMDIVDITYEKAKNSPNLKNKNSFLFLWGYIIIIIIIHSLSKENFTIYFKKVRKTSFLLNEAPLNLSFKHKIRLCAYKLLGLKIAGKLEYESRKFLGKRL